MTLPTHSAVSLLACSALAGPPTVQGQVAGSLDMSFNPVVGTTQAFSRVIAVAPQPDGKLLVGGVFAEVQGQSRQTLARLTPEGGLESTATFNPGVGPNAIGVKVAVQADGRILISGAFSQVAGQPRGSIARLEPNGTLESSATFNTGTGATTAAGGTAYIHGMALQPDGKIIVCGSFTKMNDQNFGGIARLLPNGSVESTAGFNPGGGVVNQVIYCTAVQPDGKILVGGAFSAIGGQPRGSIARLLPNGNVESTATFNTGTGIQGNVNAIAVQPDGKILVSGGFSTVNGQPRGGLVRLLPDGSVESTETFHPDTFVAGFGIALQADGKIVVVFPAAPGRIVRLWPDGTRESAATFNVGTGPWASISSDLSCLSLQADGKILIGGTIDQVNGTARTNLARLHNDPATQRLAATNDRVHWLRGGTSPEVSYVTFEHSVTGGAPWTMLGFGTRVAGGWELSGIGIPSSGRIRARGRTAGGQFNGSSGLVENLLDLATSLKLTAFTVTASPEGGRRIAATAAGGIGAASALMELQASDAMSEWNTVATMRADSEGRAAFDYTNPGGNRRYYRVRLP